MKIGNITRLSEKFLPNLHLANDKIWNDIFARVTRCRIFDFTGDRLFEGQQVDRLILNDWKRPHVSFEVNNSCTYGSSCICCEIITLVYGTTVFYQSRTRTHKYTKNCEPYNNSYHSPVSASRSHIGIESRTVCIIWSDVTRPAGRPARETLGVVRAQHEFRFIQTHERAYKMHF